MIDRHRYIAYAYPFATAERPRKRVETPNRDLALGLAERWDRDPWTHGECIEVVNGRRRTIYPRELS